MRFCHCRVTPLHTCSRFLP